MALGLSWSWINLESTVETDEEALQCILGKYSSCLLEYVIPTLPPPAPPTKNVIVLPVL